VFPSNEVSYSGRGTPPAFRAIVVKNGQLLISWNSIPGQTYQVQFTTNLNQYYWQSVGAAIAEVDNSASVIEPVRAGRSAFLSPDARTGNACTNCRFSIGRSVFTKLRCGESVTAPSRYEHRLKTVAEFKTDLIAVVSKSRLA